MLKEWTDSSLVWNPLEYGNVDMLYVPAESIWIPDLVLYNKSVLIMCFCTCMFVYCTMLFHRYSICVCMCAVSIYISICFCMYVCILCRLFEYAIMRLYVLVYMYVFQYVFICVFISMCLMCMHM